MNFVQRSMCAVVTLGAVAATAHAAGDAFIDPALGGNATYDSWTILTAAAYPGYPGFPGSGTWTPMASQAGSGGATLTKVSGSAYPGTAGVYFGSFGEVANTLGGTLAVVDAAPVDDLKFVTLQIEYGEAWGYDFYNHQLPLLSYNGGAQNLAVTSNAILAKVPNGSFETPSGPEPIYVNTYFLTWDLNNIASPITSFSISFSGVQHSQVNALRVDQSNVPEPGALSLITIAGAALLRRRRA